jgi:uncharacterized protein (TIGR00661 family)
MATTKKVLICPQHWGLGHVTRTIPVIQYFVRNNYDVILACSGAGSELLRREFPQFKLYEIPDYGINYPYNSMVINITLQFFKMHIAIVKEHFAIKKICKEEKIDLIVSDARLGASQKNIPSVIIAHHLHFDLGMKVIEWICDTWMKMFYLTFDQLWIPDLPGFNNLSGDLAHLYKSKKRYFLGILTRFKKLDVEKKYDYAIMLSGPEPPRTILEDILLNQLSDLMPEKCILIRGILNGVSLEKYKDKYQENLEIKDFVNGAELNEIMCASDFIICRSGYSTLLDLAIIHKPALLIPTPGQPEQEYLSRELERKKLFHSVEQKKIQLGKDVEIAKTMNGYEVIRQEKSLDEILDELISRLGALS